jgi:hypothetical protein
VFDAIDCIVEWNSNSWAGKTACVLGGICTLVGGGEAIMAAKAVASAGGALSDAIQLVDKTIDLLGETTIVSNKRSLNQTLLEHLSSIIIPGQKQYSLLTLIAMIMADNISAACMITAMSLSYISWQPMRLTL